MADPPIHPRTVISRALVAKLRNPAEPGGEYPTQAGANVEYNWPLPVPPENLPIVIIWANTEELQEAYQNMPVRLLNVNVGILVDGPDVDTIDQKLDSIALEVEQEILADRRLRDDDGNDRAMDIQPSQGANKDIGEDDSERLTGGLGMQFQVKYAYDFDRTGQLDKFLRFRGELILAPYLHPEQGEIDAKADVDYLLW